MLNTKLQVPISSTLLMSAKKKAESLGFSSINDFVRVILKQFNDGEINLRITSKFDEHGLEYMSDEEQADIAKILKRNRRLGLDKPAMTEIVTM